MVTGLLTLHSKHHSQVVCGVVEQLPGMRYAEPVKHRMSDFSKGGMKMKDDEEANAGIAIIGIVVIALVVWGIILIVKGVIALIVFLGEGVQERFRVISEYYFSNQDYIYSAEFLVHGLAVVGGLYLASHLFIPFCKLVDSLVEIVVVLPFIILGWSCDILFGTFLFVQKALVRPWNPNYDNGAPSFENRGLNN